MKDDNLKQFDAMKNDILKKVLTKDALERLGRVRIANPLLATQLELYMVQLYQSGQMKGSISDKKLKQILDVLVPKKRKTKI